jgi:glycosyltransferase involved in cell wall biosynthesis
MVAHCAYRLRGGEDAVVESEIELLRSRGHAVVEYRRHNDELATLHPLRAVVDTLWSRRTVEEVGEVLREQQPDVLHIHNTLPLISPSIYTAAERAGVTVVQTLHNFRLLCPQAMLLRDGKICEDCVGRAPWPGVVHACYRNSRPQSAAVAGMLVLHRGLHTWSRKIHRYVALNDFCRDKFVEGGLPAERIAVKPNFVDAPDAPVAGASRTGLLFVGRLSHEKGIATLASAAAALPHGSLRVAGSGPDGAGLDVLPSVTVLGALHAQAVAKEMARAVALVMPSIWYENFPRTLVEAYAAGLPVIASRLGALERIVDDGVTGLLFDPGNPADLANKLNWALAHPERMGEMGRAARAVYERRYTADTNYGLLLDIYAEAMALARRALPPQ